MKISAKRGLLISQIPDLGVYTITTPLIGQISIKTGFPWSQKPSQLEESLITSYEEEAKATKSNTKTL